MKWLKVVLIIIGLSLAAFVLGILLKDLTVKIAGTLTDFVQGMLNFKF
jgi:hypothetical protein